MVKLSEGKSINTRRQPLFIKKGFRRHNISDHSKMYHIIRIPSDPQPQAPGLYTTLFSNTAGRNTSSSKYFRSSKIECWVQVVSRVSRGGDSELGQLFLRGSVEGAF